MPIVTLKFKLPEEDYEMKSALKGGDYRYALHRIGNEIFRPARKHGYPNEKLQALMDSNEVSYEIVDMLEKRFYEILGEEQIELD